MLISHMAKHEPDFMALSGSRLYGSNTVDSDVDIRGFLLPPLEYLIGFDKFDYIEIDGNDHKIYGLKKFISMVLQGDPNLTEVLFTPEHHIFRITPIGRAVLENRNLFLSNRIYERIVGYGNSEFRKAMGERLVFDKRSKTDDDIIAWIRDNKKWNKDRMDQFVTWMDEDRPSTIVSSLQGITGKRQKEFDRFGFGVTSASHSLRLAEQLIELMRTGSITFPRPNAELLRDIKLGKYTKEQIVEMRNEVVAKVDKSRQESVLPDHPNDEATHDLYIQLVRKRLSIG
jgi:hypothetical protein